MLGDIASMPSFQTVGNHAYRGVTRKLQRKITQQDYQIRLLQRSILVTVWELNGMEAPVISMLGDTISRCHPFRLSANIQDYSDLAKVFNQTSFIRKSTMSDRDRPAVPGRF
jgi:hypothetical protein